MKQTDEEIPQPIAGKRYSGKFMVRVPEVSESPSLKKMLDFDQK